MKTLKCIITYLIFSSQTFAQKPISYSYTEISRAQFDSCVKVKYLVINPRIRKHSGKLIIPVAGKKSRIFIDDGEFSQYEYLGDIKRTAFSLIRWDGPNEEEFYLISRFTGSADTLIGQPVFSNNLTDFACANNPGTDEKQQIQVCEIKNGNVNTRAYIKSKADTYFFKAITCIRRNSILVEDNSGKYWELNFQTNDRYGYF